MYIKIPCTFIYTLFFLFISQGSAAGKGISNGSYKGHRLFTCPEGCAVFVPVSHVRLRHWSHDSDAPERAHQKDHHRSSNNDNANDHHFNNARLSHQQQQPNRRVIFQQHRPSSPPQHQASGILNRGESVPVVTQDQNHVRSPASPPPFHVGQRVCFPLDDSVCGGEVRFCGLLPGRSSSGMYVGVLLVSTFPAKVFFEFHF